MRAGILLICLALRCAAQPFSPSDISARSLLKRLSDTNGPAVDITTGMVAYWNFNESSGTIASDSSGHGNTATFGQGTPVFNTTKGILNNCWDNSAGVGAFTNFMAGGGLPVFNASVGYSLSMWFNPSAIGANMDLYTEQLSSNANSLFRIYTAAGGKLTVQLRDASNTILVNVVSVGAPVAQTNQWHHIVFTATSAGVANLYIDNVLDPTNYNYSVATAPTLDQTCVGGYVSGSSVVFQFKGLMDETRLYRTVLTTNQIAALYNQGPGVDLLTGMVAYWKFDESSGIVASDSSTNGNNASYSVPGTTLFYPGGHLNNCMSNYVGVMTNLTTHGLPVYTTNSNWGVSMWLKAFAGIGGFAYGDACTTTQGYLLLQLNTSGTFQINIRTDSGSFGLTLTGSKTSPGDTTWHHIVCTGAAAAGNGTAYIYVDGVLDKSTTYTLAQTTINTSGVGGYTTSTGPHASYQGLIDEVRVYNIFLSPVQVTALSKL